MARRVPEAVQERHEEPQIDPYLFPSILETKLAGDLYAAAFSYDRETVISRFGTGLAGVSRLVTHIFKHDIYAPVKLSKDEATMLNAIRMQKANNQ